MTWKYTRRPCSIGETAELLRLKFARFLHVRSVYRVGETAVTPCK